MTALPAVVTITDLPLGTTPSGAELIECVQTSGGVAISVQLSLAQVAAALPSVLATVAGLSVLGVAGISSAIPLAITGAANQVLIVNNGGTALLFGPLNLAASVAVTGVLSTANMTAVNLATTGGGGVTGQPIFLPATALPSAGSTAVGMQISSASIGLYVGTGTPTFSAAKSSLYLNAGGSNATSRLFINLGGTATWTAVLTSG